MTTKILPFPTLKYESMALGVILFLIYLPLGAISAQLSDSGELATTAFTGGLIHPPGYPLYWLLSQLLLTVFPFEPFVVLSVFSALCQSLAAVVLYRLLRSREVTIYLALATVAAFAFFSTAIKAASDVEVFGLHHLLIILLVAEALVGKRAAWLGFFAGLAAANHHTAILIAPLVLASLLSQDIWATVKQIWKTFLFTLPGFSLYLLLFVPSFDSLTYFGPIESWQDWIDHILRVAYGTFSIHESAVDADGAFNYFYHFLSFIFKQLPFLFILPLLIFCNSKKKDVTFYGWLISVFLCILFLNQLKFSNHTFLLNIEIAGRFFTFPILLLLVGTVFLKQSRLDSLLVFLLLLPVGINFQHNYRAANARQDLFAIAETEQIFASIPEGSIYFTQTDRESFGLAYAQMVHKRRPDLIVLLDGFSNSQYLKLIKKRFTIFKDIAVDIPLSLVQVYEIARQNQRQVFSSRINSLPKELKTQTWGNLYKWISNTEVEDPLLAIESIALACSNFPKVLENTPSERQSTWIAIRSKYINPLVRAINLAEGEKRHNLQLAHEAALEMDFKNMRRYCVGKN